MSNGYYRHELKYYLNSGDYTLLSSKLQHTMPQDRYAERNGGDYFIRSLYFDDIDDCAFREKLSGVNERDKYRIRIYNMRDDTIKLERKHKQDGYIKKDSIVLSRAEADALISGTWSFLAQRQEPAAKRMAWQFATHRMLPRVIVDYTREAYTFPVQDVRVTFDKNIRTGYRAIDIWSAAAPTYPVIEDYDTVMEIKFNRYLPTYIRSLLQTDSHVRSAISKYCICRKFEL